MSRAASGGLGISDELVLIASTGIIGQRLPVRKIIEGMDGLVEGLRPGGIAAAEEAIMTTDKFPKMSQRKAMVGGKEITLCGIAKGAGMISPTMATMLAFFLTDADIEASALRGVFRQSVNKTFNAITVDGCMSTNDTAIILANGLASNKTIRRGAKDFSLFKEILCSTMLELAEAIVRDGEGATKVMEVTIEGATSVANARKVAYAVANSNLVKTAFFGCDPNWGRIISAIGSVNIPLSAGSVKVFLEDAPLFANGSGITGYEPRLAEIMAQPYIKLKVNLGMGNRFFRVLASDLGYDYVKINAHYHT
jgi:glutamate N-acetyltransferase/amino-acid N-acetyltransferase